MDLKDNDKLVILEKDRPVLGVGSLIELTGSVGRLTENPNITNKTIAKLLKPYSRDSTPRETIIGSDVYMSYLQKIKLI